MSEARLNENKATLFQKLLYCDFDKNDKNISIRRYLKRRRARKRNRVNLYAVRNVLTDEMLRKLQNEYLFQSLKIQRDIILNRIRFYVPDSRVDSLSIRFAMNDFFLGNIARN